MGGTNSKERLREYEKEISTLRGRLQEIPRKNKEIDRLNREVELLKKRLSRQGVQDREEESLKLKEKIKELTDQLNRTKAELAKRRSIQSLTSAENVGQNWERRIGKSSGRISTGDLLQKFRTGISAEPGKLSEAGVLNSELTTHSKPMHVKELIRVAIQENDLLNNLDPDQMNEIIECMEPSTVPDGEAIIKEGEDGDRLYVIETGEARVTKLTKQGVNKEIRIMGEKTLFGELAILYSTPRTASVTAVSNCQLWFLERLTFQLIMMRSGLKKHSERMEMVKTVPAFKDYSEELLSQIVDAFDEDQYESDEYIIREGATGETFYIILTGKVMARKKLSSGKEETRFLSKGDYFGERALEGEEVRTESMMVCSPEGATCLTMDRDTLKSILEKNVKLMRKPSLRVATSVPRDVPEPLRKLRLGDICIVETLGMGGFGRVELVQIGEDSSKSYALKQIKKHYVVEMKQQDHILNERRILLECRSDFIIRLYRTYRNNKYVYMLMEACLGGELWWHLRECGPFRDVKTRFYIGCTMEALAYLHARGIIYRDLKPENLIMDSEGYLKLVDFGFAKKIGHGKKTWTFCGTTEYIAPEIILNKGHDFTVDLWSLGILMFELLAGNPPFTEDDPMRTYNKILKGIDSVNFPRVVSKNAKDLIKKLCRESPNERLGYGRAGIVEVEKHKWFDGFNWEGLRKHSLESPMRPPVRSATDTTNFDKYPEDTDTVPEEKSNWDKEFAEF